MKRSPILQPLSREHHSALTLAKACERAARSGDASQVESACQRAIQAYSEELEAHFQIEEQSLLPLLQSQDTLAQRTLAEHRQLRSLLNDLRCDDANALASFGRRLAEHVRFEERILFAALEDVLHEPDGEEK